MKQIQYFRLTISCLLLLFISWSCIQQPGAFSDPDSLVIYPSPPAKTRIQYLTSFSSSTDIKGDQTSISKFIFGEENPLPIVKPYGVTVRNSKIYICDTGIRGLVILDMESGTFAYFIPKGKGELQFPINCAIDEKGNLYIADGNRKQVVIFDSDLKYLNEISLKGNVKPTDIFVDSTRLWISAVDDHKIFVYNKSDLRYQSSFPDALPESEEYLYQPANIQLTEDRVYISDFGDCKVKIFDKDFNYIDSFGGAGRGFGQFTRPKGISVDREGNIYVVDAAFENIQIFSPENDLLLNFGGTYSGPGGMWLPADVTIDYDNLHIFEKYLDPSFKLEYLIFVTNQYGPDKLSVYGFVGLTE